LGTEERTYGRRRGRKLRPQRQALLDALLPSLSVPIRAGEPLDPQALFPSAYTAVWLEIGFGAGEHLAWQAERHPQIGMIGCEFYRNGIASLLRHIVERRLENVRIHPDDAGMLLERFPAASIGRIFLLHPDPWPKARHAARRFLGPANLDRFARVMADGAELRIATDHPVYKTWTLWQIGKHPEFEWLARSPGDWTDRPPDWPATRYEQKASRAGRTCLYLRYRRVPRRK
jgi:tRNA (guanine-N7-)-methyltransferase